MVEYGFRSRRRPGSLQSGALLLFLQLAEDMGQIKQPSAYEVSKNQEPLLGSPGNRDHSLLGSILETPHLWLPSYGVRLITSGYPCLGARLCPWASLLYKSASSSSDSTSARGLLGVKPKAEQNVLGFQASGARKKQGMPWGHRY